MNKKIRVVLFQQEVSCPCGLDERTLVSDMLSSIKNDNEHLNLKDLLLKGT